MSSSQAALWGLYAGALYRANSAGGTAQDDPAGMIVLACISCAIAVFIFVQWIKGRK